MLGCLLILSNVQFCKSSIFNSSFNFNVSLCCFFFAFKFNSRVYTFGLFLFTDSVPRWHLTIGWWLTITKVDIVGDASLEDSHLKRLEDYLSTSHDEQQRTKSVLLPAMSSPLDVKVWNGALWVQHASNQSAWSLNNKN